MKKIVYSFAVSLTLFTPLASAQVNSLQLSVIAEATIQEQPPRIALSWLQDDSAISYTVYRYDTNLAWWNSAVAVGKKLTWTDTNVAVGIPYEYEIVKQGEVPGVGAVTGYGYVYTGIDVPAQECSGTVILVVDDTFASQLSAGLTQWQNDVVEDGWRVIRHDVSRSASVETVKALIYADMQNDTTAHTLFLFGHVPVPYSGFLNPDGHPQHFGAWPADVYYGDTMTVWTDTEYDSLSSAAQGVGAANINVPGDGKFDESTTTEVDLQIGRVDFANMPDFALSEEQLLQQYLNKDHAFRIGTLTAPKRALLSDNFLSYGEGFACDGWRNFGNLVGGANIFQLDWFSTLDTASYLWAYGCGGGDPTDASGIGSTTDFATDGTKAIFTMLFGSWFGDWNFQNDFMRAPLAAPTSLTCCWGGRPHWYFDHMAMGQTIGSCTQLSENAPPDPDGLYDELDYSVPIVQGVHMDLMGDPTLRMAYAFPPSDFVSVSAKQNGNAAQINWQTNPSAEGYNVYRAHYWNDSYTKLNAIPDGYTVFIDSLPFSDSDYYEVRAVTTLGDTHGTYYSVGQPSKPVKLAGLAGVASTNAPSNAIRIASDGPFLTAIVDYNSEEPARLAVYDISGREVSVLDPALQGVGEHEYTLDTRASDGWASGVYFVRLLSAQEPLITKFVVTQ
jgi:hypothetical protein